MALQDPQAEPSMEEILASIRRIISEDDAPPAEPVLELSTPATEPELARAPAPPAPDEDDLLVFDQAAPAAPAEPAPAPYIPPPPTPHEAIVSAPVVSATAHSFTRLAGTLRLSDTEGQSIEGVVRELLRPMLADWLERNLPSIVESKVEAELDRISRLAR